MTLSIFALGFIIFICTAVGFILGLFLSLKIEQDSQKGADDF